MKPRIDATTFGSIDIAGRRYDHDVVIRPDGTVEKRKKKLSKRVYGTSHTVSADEARHLLRGDPQTLIAGTGQHGALGFSDEALALLREADCALAAQPTPAAVAAWNAADGPAAGLFHVTC